MSTDMAERKYRSMSEMQQEAQTSARGLACPNCGSTATEVARTTRDHGVIVRERRCLHCKTRLPKSYETF